MDAETKSIINIGINNDNMLIDNSDFTCFADDDKDPNIRQALMMTIAIMEKLKFDLLQLHSALQERQQCRIEHGCNSCEDCDGDCNGEDENIDDII
jgi:hypothetical protein